MTKLIQLFLIAILFIVLPSAFADGEHTPIGDAVEELPIFDAHMHYKEPAWDAYSVVDIVELMDESGVAMGLVSSSPDEGTIMLWEYAPNRIIPELRPYHGDAGSSNWSNVTGMDDYKLLSVSEGGRLLELETRTGKRFRISIGQSLSFKRL